jgi:hypothetical protein
MTHPFDVASRLAEGRPAVEDIDQYVAACHRLGFQHPDLTAHSAQVRDWYASEEGLDLRALDGDCAVLSAVASSAEDAARMQSGLVAELSGAWSGRGAAAASEFTSRSGQAATAVSAAIRAAADATAGLRDALWRAVDAKVAAVEAIDGRHQAQRAEWLAAATTVTSGAGDLAAASELVDQQVKPFVANDIGSDWLAAMRTAAASISGAYAAALASTAAAPRAVFDVPGELGPRAEAPEPAGRSATGGDATPSSTRTMPAAVVSSAPPIAAAMAPSPPSPPGPPAAQWSGPAPAVAPPPTDPMAQVPAASPMAQMPAASSALPSPGDLGAGTSSLGSGLSGFGQQLADLIGGLVGSSDGGLSDPAAIDELDDLPDEPSSDPEDPDDPDDPEADEPDDVAPEAAAAEEGEGGEAANAEEAAKVSEACGGVAAEEPVPDAVAVSTPVEPRPDSPPPPEPAAEVVGEVIEPTPCEIAADELPQVGE